MTRLSEWRQLADGDSSATADRWRRRLGQALFGDRYGVVLFLGTLVVLATYWRVGVFVTDSYAIANGLVNVADGHLAITRMEYSITLGSQPGLWYADGAVYARNYAYIFLSLPALWLLDALAVLFDLRLVLAGAWSGLLLLLFDRVGRLTSRPRRVATAGAALALGTFLGSALVAAPLADRWTAFLALQVTGMLAVAFTAVVLYRVLAHAHGRRVGLLFGAAAALASPVGFWASIPKRHVLSAFAVVAVLGAFYFSRVADSPRRALGLRALAYAVLGLFAWLHAMEALIVFAVFVPVDLATARSLHPKHLAVVGVVFLVALTPFLATNAAINGDPLQPPRALEHFSGQVDPITIDGGQSGGDASPTPTATDAPAGTAESTATETRTANTTDGPTATAPPDTDEPPGPIGVLLGTLTALVALVLEGIARVVGEGWSYVAVGLAIAQENPERLLRVFIRSGSMPEFVTYEMTDYETVDLALLEVAPLLGGLLGVLGAGALRVRDRSVGGLRAAFARPIRQADLLVVAIAVVFVLVNLDRLPLHTQITVRHLSPLVPLGLYGVARLTCVHRAVSADSRWLLGSYSGTLVAGGLGFLLTNLWLGLALGEAMQLHALVNLASAGLLAGWAFLAGLGIDLDDRVGVVALAVPAALSTLFLLFTGLVYFQYADYVLPLAERLVELVPIAV